MVGDIVVIILFCSRSLSLIYQWEVTFSICFKVIYYSFDKFHSTRPTMIRRLPPRLRTDAHMHMWGKLFPKREELEWSFSVVQKFVCDLFSLEDKRNVFNLVLYPYAGMHWRGSMNI